MQYNGINTATRIQAQAHCLCKQGVRVVGRYYSKLNPWKLLLPKEAQALVARDLQLMAIWQESATHASYFTYQRGLRDGADATGVGEKLGQPGNTPIYFAVDYDAVPPDRAPIISYLSGVEESLSAVGHHADGFRYALGVYGSCWVLNWCRAWGKIHYFMQAYPPAWSGGDNAQPWKGFSVRQVSSNQGLCGIVVDHLQVTHAAGCWQPCIAQPTQ